MNFMLALRLSTLLFFLSAIGPADSQQASQQATHNPQLIKQQAAANTERAKPGAERPPLTQPASKDGCFQLAPAIPAIFPLLWSVFTLSLCFNKLDSRAEVIENFATNLLMGLYINVGALFAGGLVGLCAYYYYQKNGGKNYIKKKIAQAAAAAFWVYILLMWGSTILNAYKDGGVKQMYQYAGEDPASLPGQRRGPSLGLCTLDLECNAGSGCADRPYQAYKCISWLGYRAQARAGRQSP
jgi:hypothetical protein